MYIALLKIFEYITRWLVKLQWFWWTVILPPPPTHVCVMMLQLQFPSHVQPESPTLGTCCHCCVATVNCSFTIALQHILTELIYLKDRWKLHRVNFFKVTVSLLSVSASLIPTPWWKHFYRRSFSLNTLSCVCQNVKNLLDISHQKVRKLYH